ncbi:MAG: cupredoxin domain-containing protein, partial [Pseudonocardiaceae bacterium]
HTGTSHDPSSNLPAGCSKPGTSPSSGTSLSISAKDIEFDVKCLVVPAGEKFTVSFENQEAVNHNFAILPEAGKGAPLSDTGIFTGPAVRNLDAGPLKAGNYRFHCIVHPNMTGSLVVE